jgi:hypothetical protein
MTLLGWHYQDGFKQKILTIYFKPGFLKFSKQQVKTAAKTENNW